MNRKACCMLLALGAIAMLPAEAQQQSPTPMRKATPRTIFEALEGEAPGEGYVVINQSDELKKLVGATSARYRAILGREGNTTLMHGYRIQVYNGNLVTSKAEMDRRAAQLRRLAPEYSCYPTYNAPFWRLVVGDFVSDNAARAARAKLLKVMPAWFQESYIVRDKVRILNYNPDKNEY